MSSTLSCESHEQRLAMLDGALQTLHLHAASQAERIEHVIDMLNELKKKLEDTVGTHKRYDLELAELTGDLHRRQSQDRFLIRSLWALAFGLLASAIAYAVKSIVEGRHV